MIQTLKMWGANAVIAGVLVLMLTQAWPGVPIWLSWRPAVVGELLCIWQGPWSMFTPEPDSENHRLGAVIEYEDGHVVKWESPNWREQGALQRFIGHRRCEYIDAMRNSTNSGALEGMAAWLARTQRQDTAPRQAARVEIFVKHRDIPDPRIHGWKLADGPFNFNRQTPLYDGRPELRP